MVPAACGLDFGTSNSTLGVTDAIGRPGLLPMEAGQETLPSVLFFSFEDDKVHFGRQGISEYADGAEGRLMRSIKSVLGTALMADTTRIRQRKLGFSEILEIFIAEMKRRGEEAAGNGFDSAVVGRPVHFVDEDETADATAQDQLEAAVRASGFAHIEFQFEPIAAALDYERRIEGEELALVVDIGGGTSDFTIIRLSPERARRADRTADILATGGVHVGGTDFDQLLSFRKVMPVLGLGSGIKDSARLVPAGPYFDLATWHRINRLYAARPIAELRSTLREAADPDKVGQMVAIVEGHYGHALAGTVEETKIALSSADQAVLHFERDGVDLHLGLSAGAFEVAIAEAAARIPHTIDKVLASAGLDADDIQTVLMTGGSTQLRLIRSGLDVQFPGARFFQTDAFGSVGTGLALDAARKFG